MQRWKSRVWLALALTSWSCGTAAAADSAESLRPLHWSAASVNTATRGITALALEADSDRLALGDEQGVLLGRRGGSFARVLQRGPVRDVAFLADGSLLAATQRGLYRVASGRATRLRVAPGLAARSVQRIAVVPDLIALATDAGIFISRDARAWQRLAGGLPAEAARAVALRSGSDSVGCYGVIGGELWRVEIRDQGHGLVAASPERQILPAAIRGGGAVDLATDIPGTPLVVVYPRALAAPDPDAPTGSWRVWQPELPPGARAQRLGAGAGRRWLSSDRGLFLAADLTGPWRRAAPPLGSSPIGAAAGGAGVLYVAVRDDLRVGRDGPGSPRPGRSTPRAAAGPPIARVHRAALHYLGLEPGRMEALRRGASRRGWWPVVGLRGGGEWDHDLSVDSDQSFVSGATRHLVDHARDRGNGYDLSVSLSWDLGAIAYEPESIDVSRETREVIELRDDVLDEVTQLYFEWRRVLAELAASSASNGDAATALKLRADELAAGIDAWTGGWFSRQLALHAP